ncbi:MAG: hypothetical protein ISS45_06015 [Candidatus Omnitrophica bacterium]|nr:hypothetical protein [Candidatus Omnitrophota bacterium]
MKKMIILMLCAMLASGVLSNSLSAMDAKAIEGEELFTRTNLKAQGSKVFFQNMSKLKGFIPVGTAVGITKVGKQYIKFKVLDTGKQYKLEALSDFYDRYFVKNIDDVGLQNINEKTMQYVNNMQVEPGMTKEEVYISRGCPAFIGWGIKSWFATLDEIMSSNTWYYNAGTSKIEMLVIFENGVVKEATSKIKKP